MASQSVKMDNLFYSLKELQNEKVCLEKKLHGLKSARRSLESELEQDSTKGLHVQEKHMRISEMYAVAQQKVEESMNASTRLQAQLDNSRPKLAEIQTTIEQEKSSLSGSVDEFQDKVCHIASELFDAKSFYKNSFLTSEAEKVKKELENLLKKEETFQLRNKDLENRKEKLDTRGQSHQSEYGVEILLAELRIGLQKDREETKKGLTKKREELESVDEAVKPGQ